MGINVYMHNQPASQTATQEAHQASRNISLHQKMLFMRTTTPTNHHTVITTRTTLDLKTTHQETSPRPTNGATAMTDIGTVTTTRNTRKFPMPIVWPRIRMHGAASRPHGQLTSHIQTAICAVKHIENFLPKSVSGEWMTCADGCGHLAERFRSTCIASMTMALMVRIT